MIKFAFFGTTEFSVKVLNVLLAAGLSPELVMTAPDKPAGRGLKLQSNPVKLWAEKNKIKYITNYELEIKNYDFNIIAAYGKILPKEIISIPTINVHPSLLPKFRGASPIQSFILSGEQTTGVTLMLTDEQIDHGPILAKSEIRSTKHETYKELEIKLAELGGKMLIEIIPDFISGKIKSVAQDHSQATFTKKITKQDGLVNLEKDDPEIIERKIRAFTPWPSAYTFINGKRIIITKAELTNEGKLKILRIKPEGKNEMDAGNFYFSTNGTKAKPG
jgi:methionyl-tRNA formyltransferase